MLQPVKEAKAPKGLRPIFKWPGGKYRVLPYIRAALPRGQRLIEPFAGSAVVSLNSDYKRYCLNDINRDLIDFYRILKSEGPSFIAYAKKFFSATNNKPKRYYEFRETFNSSQNQRLRSALFLYLNKHGYNGLIRYNASGAFNVPFGKFKRPYFPADELINFIILLRRARILCQDFESVISKAKSGDVVYCDPPYVPLSQTSYFTSYSSGGFSFEDQLRLVDCAKQAAARGIPVLISNHLTSFTEQAYSDADIITFSVQRQISRDGANRKRIMEILALFKPN